MSSRLKLRFVTFLTFVRFPLVMLFFVGAVIHALEWKTNRPLWLFMATFTALILSAITDLFDGYFARKFDVVTKLGAHADPLMDKFFFLASLPLLVFVATLKPDHRVHATLLLVLTLLFLARDQWVTFLRSIGSIYAVSGRAHWSGKLRTAISFPIICAIYFVEEAPPSIQFVPMPLIYAFEIIAMIVNAVSLVIYTRRYFPYLLQSADLTTTSKKAN